jgi:hypothetical protein
MMELRLDENLQVRDGRVVCARCETALGAGDADFLADALWREAPATAAPSSVVRQRPEHFVDRPVGLRQAFCPSCLTLLMTEVVPVDEPSFRLKRIEV